MQGHATASTVRGERLSISASKSRPSSPALTRPRNERSTGSPWNRRDVLSKGLLAVRYVDNYGTPTERYPLNPNGSPEGITGLTSTDGRSTLLMPHPERVHRTVQMSWHPQEWGEASPWLRLFRNARVWVG